MLNCIAYHANIVSGFEIHLGHNFATANNKKSWNRKKFPTIYMGAMHQLTGSGMERVFAN
jgi:hypothetical protein